MTGVLIRRVRTRGEGQVQTLEGRVYTRWTPRNPGVAGSPRSWGRGWNRAAGLMVDFWPPDGERLGFCCWKPPGL